MSLQKWLSCPRWPFSSEVDSVSQDEFACYLVDLGWNSRTARWSKPRMLSRHIRWASCHLREYSRTSQWLGLSVGLAPARKTALLGCTLYSIILGLSKRSDLHSFWNLKMKPKRNTWPVLHLPVRESSLLSAVKWLGACKINWQKSD